MEITIQQGSEPPHHSTDVAVVIDVLRAFTVAHYAFIRGAKKIYLVHTIEEAFQLKEEHPDYLLAGEVKGLPIEGFDLDNSPARLLEADVESKVIVQKTTNGVRATLNQLEYTNHLFVAGFSNARITADYLKNHLKINEHNHIHLVASHPTGDEDLVCAEYIQALLLGKESPKASLIQERIKQSQAAIKFFDPEQSAFDPRDVELSMQELDTAFVMKVNKTKKIPMIERVNF